MSAQGAIHRLIAVSRSFGRANARAKVRLLAAIECGTVRSARDLAALHDALCFIRAYPDDREVLRRAAAVTPKLREWLRGVRGGAESSVLLDTGFPGSTNRHPFSFPVLGQMLRVLPDCLDIDWDEFDDDAALHNALVLVVTNGECQGLDDIRSTTPEWVEACRQRPDQSDLQLLHGLFEGSHLRLQEKAYLWDSSAVPVRYDLARPGTGRGEITWPCGRVHYQTVDIPRDRAPLGPRIRRAFGILGPVDAATGRTLVQLALRALGSRCLEISSLMYADPRDVTLLDCGRGLQILLIGVIPEYRDAHETTYFCLILKNGVPIAYGPASVCLGCCEMGINLFPEFRGGEIRYVYSQFMRALYHALGARYFYLTSYGMGEGNPEAIRTGAFWFYRKMGFVASNPDVEALARAEEAEMRARPAHRSSNRTLRKLSVTSAFFDLSDGACQPLDLGAIGRRQSRFIADRYGGDRRRAVEHCAQEVARVLGVADVHGWPAGRRRALKILAPTLCMIDGFAGWSSKDKQRMLRVIRQKGGRSEARADRLVWEHTALRDALRDLARP